jgi:glycosyltransferase involved in cell wall biosynthesis
MRILKIVNSRDSGGVLTCEMQFIKHFQIKGHIVDLVILGDGPKRETYEKIVTESYCIKELGVSYNGTIPEILKGIWKSRNYGVKNAKLLLATIKDKPDVIIYRRPTYLFLAGSIAASFGIPLFWHLPNTVNSAFSRKFYTFFCSSYKIVPVANSKFTQKSLFPLCKYVVFPGFDENRVLPEVPIFREMLKIDKGIPVYGVLSRICYDKAQDILIQAFNSSKVAQHGGHLIIAGAADDPSFLTYLKSLAGDKLDKQIHFIGNLDNVQGFYASIDVAINSRRNVEAFGISIAEALGAAKPVIAYKLGGPSELIVHDKNGWLVDRPDPEAYCKAIDLSFSRKDKWLEIGKAGLQKSTDFSAEKNVDNFLKIIRGYL